MEPRSWQTGKGARLHRRERQKVEGASGANRGTLVDLAGKA